jgi:hypothetical protein
MAGEGDTDLGFVADNGFAGDVVDRAVEDAGERQRPGCTHQSQGSADARH